MKAQLSLEFMAVTLISVVYLLGVFTLYSSIKTSLETAADKKTADSVSQWIDFIARRPPGTRIKLDFRTYPKRWLAVSCGDPLRLMTPRSESSLEIGGVCPQDIMNFTGEACVSIERVEGGVLIEAC